MVTYGRKTPPTKSREFFEHVVTWQRKNLIFGLSHYLWLPDLEEWYRRVMGPYPPCHGTFWPRVYVTIENRYIWNFTPPITPKRGRVVTQVRWTPPTKSRDHMVAWKTENISTLPRNLWQPNLEGWWRGVGDLVPLFLTIILVHSKIFFCKQLILEVLLLLHLLLHF